jgi:hypothetical protein
MRAARPGVADPLSVRPINARSSAEICVIRGKQNEDLPQIPVITADRLFCQWREISDDLGDLRETKRRSPADHADFR